MSLTRRGFAAGVLAFAAASLLAQMPEGTLAIMRHALAPGTGDPEGFTLGDCSTQRTLNDAGRAQAEATGAMLRAQGMRFERVLTSQWCRCRETADLLGLGPVEEVPAFNSHFAGRGDRAAQTAEALDLLGRITLPVMVVTHQVNIISLTDQSTRSGEVLIARPGGRRLEVIDSLYVAPA